MPEAVENTQIRLRTLLTGMPVPKSTAERGVLLQDIREIPIVRDNPDSFSDYLPIYFKVDLIKFILCLHSLENQYDDCVIVSDFLVGNSPTDKGWQDDKKRAIFTRNPFRFTKNGSSFKKVAA